MNTNKIIALLMCVLLVQGAFVFAQQTSVTAKEPTQITSNAEYKLIKEKMQQKATAVTETKGRIKGNITERLNGIKENWKAIVELAQARLELLKTNVELNQQIDESLKTEILVAIDDLDTRLSALIPQIDDMTTLADALQVIKDFLDIWKDYVWQAKKYLGLVLTSGMSDILGKGEQIQSMMQEKIQYYEEQGVDVSGLQSIYDSYSGHLTEAKTKNDEAIAKLNEITEWQGHQLLFTEAHTAFVQARNHVRLGWQDVKSFAEQLREMGAVIGVGTGVVFASGSGSADIAGRGSVKLDSFGNPDGVLRVWDNAGNGNINVQYDGTARSFDDGSTEYTKVTSAHIRGNDIRVYIEGNDYALKAAGRGTVILTGTGWYHFGNPDNKITFDTTTSEPVEIKVVSEVTEV
jgi:hypothetical protein